eukprot:4138167-Prymnesium_polylepis.1
MLLIAAALVRVLFITFLALVSGAARGLMLSDVGPSSKAHSACSPTPGRSPQRARGLSTRRWRRS